MFKLLDIVGFRTSSTTFGSVEKYLNTSSKKYEFILTFTFDFTESEQFYFNRNVSDISQFFNLLKNNGSMYVNYRPGHSVLIGKKLHAIKNDAQMYELCHYETDLFEEEDLEDILIVPTEKTLRNIFNVLFGPMVLPM